MMPTHQSPRPACDHCSRPASYRFGSRDESAQRCLRHAIIYPPVVQRALRVALVVGTLLFVINQADLVLRGELSSGVALKIGLTYLVPFTVSTYSALQINRSTDSGAVDRAAVSRKS
jgi:hypothetical protein